MDTTIDEVAIEIGSNSSSASKGLDALTSSIEKLFKNLDTGLSKLNDFNSKISDLKNKVSGINFDNSSISKIGSSFKELSNISKGTNLKSTTDQLKEIPAISRKIDTKPFSALQNSINKVKSSFTSLKKNTAKSNKDSLIDNIIGRASSMAKIGVITAGIQKLGSVIGGFISESSDYIEALNLFNVTFGEMSGKAKEFVNNFSNVLGVDPKNIMQYMSAFYNLANGFGVASDKAYLMSENLTQLSYDLSSFWNISQDEAMQKLKSGLAGEIEPMRAIGVALDQATLQELAYSLGIDKKVSEMTRAQKAELLYYQIMQKTTNAQGDMARTLLQPQNALRILKNQFTQLARAIGNIFLPMLMAIIPYVQVVVKWLTVLANKIAALFGFKIADYVPNTGAISSGLGDVSSGLDGIKDSASNANKELDYMLGKFDELNVIDFDKGDKNSGGSGSGAGASGGSLGLDLPTYNALENALSQNLEDVEKKLKNILPYVEAIGITFLTWKISSSILKFLDRLGLIKNLKSSLRVAAGLSIALGGAWLLYKGIKQAIDEGGLTPESLLQIVSGNLLIGAGASLTFKSFTPLLLSLGLSLAITGGYLLYEGFKKILNGELTPESIFEAISGGTLLLGSTIPLAKGLKLAFPVALEGASLGTIASTIGGIILALGGASLAVKSFFDMWKDGFSWLKEILMVIGIAIAAVGAIILGVPAGIAAAIAAVVAVVATLGIVIKEHWEEIKGFFSGIGEWINTNVIQPIVGFFQELWQKVSGFFINIWNDLVNTFQTIGTWIDENVIQPILSILVPLVTKIGEIINTIWQIIVAVFSFVAGWINDNVIQPVINFATDLWNKIKEIVSGIWNSITEVFGKVGNWINGNVIQPVVRFFTDLWNRIKEIVSGIWNSITEVFGRIAGWFANNVINPIKNLFTTAWTAIGNAASGIIKGAINGVLSSVEKVVNGFIRGLNSVVNVVNQIPGVNIRQVSQLSLPRFENGGFPDQGELFVAREAGPELVGNIGNRAAVANNDQIIQGIADASYKGVSQALAENKGNERQPVNVYIGNKKIYSGFGRQINSDNNMYGTNTIKV